MGMTDTFPLRPEQNPEGFLESFLRTSAVAWVVYAVYRFISTERMGELFTRAGFTNLVNVRSAILFSITLVAAYFTGSFRTVVYRQSVV